MTVLKRVLFMVPVATLAAGVYTLAPSDAGLTAVAPVAATTQTTASTELVNGQEWAEMARPKGCHSPKANKPGKPRNNNGSRPE